MFCAATLVDTFADESHSEVTAGVASLGRANPRLACTGQIGLAAMRKTSLNAAAFSQDQLLCWFRQRLSELFGIPQGLVTVQTRFVKDLGADSLDMVAVAMEIEEKLGIAVATEAMDKLRTVGDAIALVQSEESRTNRRNGRRIRRTTSK